MVDPAAHPVVEPALPATPHRLVYLGTPAMAVPPLRALVTAGFDVALVVTRVDTRRGRGTDTSPSPVKAAALELGIPVSHDVDDVLAADADLGVVVAFGRLIRPHLLAGLPFVNLHFSLLPRWRGAAPVERALLAGDDRTGVCLMRLEAGLDTGPVHARVEVPITADATGDSLRRLLVDVGTDLLVDQLRHGIGPGTVQDGEVTYAAKLTTDDLHLDWSRPAVERHRQVRLGGAWTTWRGKRLKVHAADLLDGDGVGAEVAADGAVGGLRLTTVQPEGKGPMSWRDLANGARITAPEILGT
ncbi:MAG: methionyl-tRNA formyltransferase [Actinobacteria bacterium]|uniref:methionyl-tRNA formyltransferase n=1 Tax=freshwater metagenome TaxID=449393 RepID=A0A6J6FJZ3_9ZZZZ|nr:methionyl-tRNA formyltransferase [Actinomycetota bacterium]